ncbi:hypothetical protein ACFOSH_38430 [Amycolatopsis speibonae]|uniref:Uncharacterized protein n=1 Tax=Amycolatopsis speibonae TaxID=1450224 RepID=A0ABV7PAD0_9PSEU
MMPWLLDSDPALRWQVERDLAHEPPESGRRRGHGSRPKASARAWDGSGPADG